MERLEGRSLPSVAFGNVAGVGSNANGANSIETSGVAVDPAGDRYVSGSFFGTVDVSGTTLVSDGLRDAFVAKYAPDGTVIYARSVGAALNDRAAGVAVDALGDAYVTGYFAGSVDFGSGHTLDAPNGQDAFVWKLAPDGTTLYAVQVTSPGSLDMQPLGIAVDPFGSTVAIGGLFAGNARFGAAATLTSGAGYFDGFLARLNADGSFAWASQLTAASGGSMQVNGVALDPGDNVIGVGQYQGVVDFDPGPGKQAHAATPNSVDVAVIKLRASDGGFVFASTPSGLGVNVATGVSTDAASDIFYTGQSQGTVDFNTSGLGSPAAVTFPAGSSGPYLVGLNPFGGVRFATSLGAVDASPYNAAYGSPSVSVGSNGTVAVAAPYTGTATPGSYRFTSAGATDVLVATLDGSGHVIQAASAGGAGADAATGVAIDGTGDLAVTGSYAGPAAFGTTTLTDKFGNNAPGVNVFTAALRAAEPVQGDFLGLGSSQQAVFRPSTAQWFALNPNNGTTSALGAFGGNNFFDIPAPGDYDGVGHTELAVFRPPTGQWIVRGPNGDHVVATFGATGLAQIPVPGDYDGIGRTEPAVYIPSTSQWVVDGPSGPRVIGAFGAPNLYDVPVPGDYDGVGYTELAVFRRATAQWIVRGPAGDHVVATFGATNFFDIPAPGDYDKLGHDQPAVFRPSTAEWIVDGANASENLPRFGGTRLLDLPATGPTASIVALSRVHATGAASGGGLAGPQPHAMSLVATPPAPAKTSVKVTAPTARPGTVPVSGPSRRPWRGPGSIAPG